MATTRREFLRSTAKGTAVVGIAAVPAVIPPPGVPTRVSTDKTDPGYEAWQSVYKDYDVHAYLDGVEQKFCETADSVRGFVMRACLDADGDLIVLEPNLRSNRFEGDPRDHNAISWKSHYAEVARETVFGKVEIKLVPRA